MSEAQETPEATATIFGSLPKAVAACQPGDGTRIYELRSEGIAKLEGAAVYIIAKSRDAAIRAYANKWRDEVRRASSATPVGMPELVKAMKEATCG